jgi:hypothetical protein
MPVFTCLSYVVRFIIILCRLRYRETLSVPSLSLVELGSYSDSVEKFLYLESEAELLRKLR